MSYQVHNFKTGQTIEAGPINEMDLQIQKNEQDIDAKYDSSHVATTAETRAIINEFTPTE